MHTHRIFLGRRMAGRQVRRQRRSSRDRRRTVYGTDRIDTGRKNVSLKALRDGYGTVLGVVLSRIRVLRTASGEGQ